MCVIYLFRGPLLSVNMKILVQKSASVIISLSIFSMSDKMRFGTFFFPPISKAFSGIV